MKLWIDDQINDPLTTFRHPTEGFIGVESVEAAIEAVKQHGYPSFLQLDHDLGTDKNGNEIKVISFLQWLFDNFPDKLPPDYAVHSQNPNGVENIHSFMGSWKKAYYL